MSNVNIKRAVENIRANTTVYTPIVEIIVNAIQAIDETDKSDGKVLIRAKRSAQPNLDGSLSDISGFEIEDNGIGFTNAHRDSFDTLYTDKRIQEGGKGFGRFTCLKYFENLYINSVYKDGDGYKVRSFSMGKDNDIIVNEKVEMIEQDESGSLVVLDSIKKERTLDKRLSTIARNIVERLLPYFITDGYTCPEIILSEMDRSNSICLNNYVRNELSEPPRFFRRLFYLSQATMA